MLSAVISPPGAPPASGAQALGRLLDVLAVTGPTREGVRDAVLQIEAHAEAVRQHEHVKARDIQHLRDERIKWEAERDLQMATINESGSAIVAEKESVQRTKVEARDIARQMRKLLAEVQL